NYGGSYVPTTNPSTDHVSCTGTAPAICNAQPVSASAQCTASTTCSPAFSVSKTCTDASAPGQPINYTGAVNNTGNTGLACQISDNKSVPSPSSANIAAGATQSYSGSYIPSGPSDTTNTVTVNCTPQETICGSTPIIHTASATCNVPVVHN